METPDGLQPMAHLLCFSSTVMTGCSVVIAQPSKSVSPLSHKVGAPIQSAGVSSTIGMPPSCGVITTSYWSSCRFRIALSPCVSWLSDMSSWHCRNVVLCATDPLIETSCARRMVIDSDPHRLKVGKPCLTMEYKCHLCTSACPDHWMVVLISQSGCSICWASSEVFLYTSLLVLTPFKEEQLRSHGVLRWVHHQQRKGLCRSRPRSMGRYIIRMDLQSWRIMVLFEIQRS